MDAGFRVADAADQAHTLHHFGQACHVIASLLGEPGVARLSDTNGRWDLLAEIRSSTLQELADVLERVRLIKGIASTETSIHLQSYKLG